MALTLEAFLARNAKVQRLPRDLHVFFCESDAPAMPALPKALRLSRYLYLATRDPAKNKKTWAVFRASSALAPR